MPEQFIQIVHNNNHWVCTSNRKCQSGEVEIFDSLMQTKVSTTVRRQLVTILHTLRPRMTMTKVCVQQQTVDQIVDFSPLHLSSIYNILYLSLLYFTIYMFLIILTLYTHIHM